MLSAARTLLNHLVTLFVASSFFLTAIKLYTLKYIIQSMGDFRDVCTHGTYEDTLGLATVLSELIRKNSETILCNIRSIIAISLEDKKSKLTHEEVLGSS